MKNEYLRNLELMESAFEEPVYSSELSQIYLKDDRPRKIIQKVVSELDQLCKAYPNEVQFLYLSGIASRYMGDQNTFLHRMHQCLEIDSSHTEAYIANREREKYLDPFCYTGIKDVLTDPISVGHPATKGLEVKSARIVQVRDGINIKPVVIIKYPKDKFRRSPLQDSEAAMGVDLCVVTDYSLEDMNQPNTDPLRMAATFNPIMVICPLIIDDKNDPFWLKITLNLFPVERQTMGIELRPLSDYQPFEGRYMGLRICSEPYQSAIIVIDEMNQVYFSKQFNFHFSDNLKLDQSKKVLKALPDTPEDFKIWKLKEHVYTKYFSLGIKTETGRNFRIPKNSREAERNYKICNLEMKDDRMCLVEVDKKKDWEIVNDVFISHAHKDDKIAYMFSNWLTQLWPDIKIFMTDTSRPEVGQILPSHYFYQINQSKCALFLCTDNSLDSSYVQLELGAIYSSNIPLFTVFINNQSLERLKKVHHENKALMIDFNRIYNLTKTDDVDALISRLQEVLGLVMPEVILSRYIFNEIDEYVFPENKKPENLGMDVEGILKPEKQTRGNAYKWLLVVEKEIIHKARIKGIHVDMLPEKNEQDIPGRIITALLTANENIYDELVIAFKPLIDTEIIMQIILMGEQAVANGDEDLKMKLEKLHLAMGKLLADAR